MKKHVPIQLIYPNEEFQAMQSTAVKTQQSLKDEAEEHYQFLKALSMTDPEYQQQLRINYERKNQVRAALDANPSWKKKITSLQSLLEQ